MTSQFVKKFNEQRIVEWNKKYVNLEALKELLASKRQASEELALLQNETKDIMVDVSGDEAETPAAADGGFEEIATPDTPEDTEASEYVRVAGRIDALEVEFWEEFNANLRKVDRFYCERLGSACEYFGEIRRRFESFGLIAHEHERVEEAVAKRLTMHKLLGPRVVIVDEDQEAARPGRSRAGHMAAGFSGTSTRDETPDNDVETADDTRDGEMDVLRRHSLQIERATVVRRVKESPVLETMQEVQPAAPDAGRKERISRSKRKKLRVAAEEFYRGLLLLQNFCSLNNEAFVVVLHKYDRMNGTQMEHTVVADHLPTTLFYVMADLKQMLAVTERVFVQAFASEGKHTLSRFKATPTLSTRSLINLGLLAGVAGVLFLLLLSQIWSYCYAVLLGQIPETKRLSDDEWVSLFLVMRVLLLAAFLQILWGIDMFIWKSVRVNFPFIFDFDPSVNFLRPLNSGLYVLNFTLVSFCLVFYCLEPPVGFAYLKLVPYWLCPLLTSIFVVVSFVVQQLRWPWLVHTLGRIMVAPFKKVFFKDFWLADQLTSIAPLFGDIVFTGLYFAFGLFNIKHAWFASNNNEEVYDGVKALAFRRYFTPFLLMLPFLLRLLQCIRSARDTGNKYQYANAGKYFASIFQTITRSSKDFRRVWTVPIWVSVSCISTIYSFVWDVVMDWGLCKKLKFLRAERFYPSWVYPVAVAVDFVLRFFWILHFVLMYVDFFETNVMVSELAKVCLCVVEVFRRGLWNVFRVEFEQTSNMDKFRATKEIPLPLPE